jgi:hypothetical protein
MRVSTIEKVPMPTAISVIQSQGTVVGTTHSPTQPTT